MYRSEKFNPTLFGKLFHLGGKLADSNRWLKLAEVLPWEKLDEAAPPRTRAWSAACWW